MERAQVIVLAVVRGRGGPVGFVTLGGGDAAGSEDRRSGAPSSRADGAAVKTMRDGRASARAARPWSTELPEQRDARHDRPADDEADAGRPTAAPR